MRIVYIAAHQFNMGWGAECFMNDALISAGCETRTLDYRFHRHRISNELLKLQDLDIFFLQRGDNFPLPIIKAIQRPRIFYFSELVSRRHDADHLFQSNLFDYYFVRGTKCKQELVKRGWLSEDKIGVHLSAFDPSTYCPKQSVHDIDVLFVGLLTPRRERILNKLSSQFKVVVRVAFGEEAARLYNRAKIVLNIHAEEFADTETRIYEVLGTKAFLISERLTEENPFQSGKHLIEANDLGDITAKVLYYLSHEAERKQIAEQGYHEAVAKHTYRARASELIKIMQRFLPENPSTGSSIDVKKIEAYARVESLLRIKYQLSRCCSQSIKRVRSIWS
jgi:hypothetical protein